MAIIYLKKNHQIVLLYYYQIKNLIISHLNYKNHTKNQNIIKILFNYDALLFVLNLKNIIRNLLNIIL